MADVAVAAGQAWRGLSPEQRAHYEQQSEASKVGWQWDWLELLGAQEGKIVFRAQVD